MSGIMAGVLLVAGPVLLVLFGVAIMSVVGLVTYDLVSERLNAPILSPAHRADREHDKAETRIHLERGVARAFVILGAAFWGVCALAVAVWYQRGMETLLFIVAVPFLMNIASLIIGWRMERFASVMLAATAGATMWWAAAHSFETGVWLLSVLLLIGPMLTASVLFWLARQGEVELALRLAVNQPELATVTAEQ
jgi:hypothetical protein